MPRYFFHTENGEPIRDESGHELPNADAARSEAVATMGEMLRDRARDFWITGRFQVTVCDASGEAIVVLSTEAEPGPN